MEPKKRTAIVLVEPLVHPLVAAADFQESERALPGHRRVRPEPLLNQLDFKED